MSSPASSPVFKYTGREANDLHAAACCYAPIASQWRANWHALFLVDGSLMIKPDPTGEAARVIYS
jgi:hypothetical protein